MARSHSSRSSCRLRRNHLSLAGGSQPLILCLDRIHRSQLKDSFASRVLLSSCPLQALDALDGNPQLVLLSDRCPATRACCRRPLGDLIGRANQGGGRAGARATLVATAANARERQRTTSVLKQLRRALLPIGQNPHPKVTVKSVAYILGVSSRQLNRLFRRLGCKSPMREFRHLILSDAYRLLRSTRVPIETIAEYAQYGNRSSFARSFRNAFGINPGAARSSSHDPT